MKHILLLITCLLFFNTNAQEKYKVVLDYQTGDLTYYKLDKNNKISDTLAKPKFKRSSLVQVQVKNVNPFAVDVKAEVKEVYIHKSGQGFNIGGLLGGIGSFTGQELKINASGLEDNSGVFGEAFRARGGRVVNKLDELNDIASNISAMKTTLLSNLSNPNLTKEQIQLNILELSKMYEDSRLSDPEQNFYKHLIDLEKIVQIDKASIENDLQSLATSIDQTTESGALSRGSSQGQAVYQSLQKTQQNLNQSTNQTTDNLNQIKTLFSQLEAASFEQTFDYQIETDKAQLELTFSPTAISGGSSAATVVRQVQMRSTGGFKINTSVALTLNSFGDKSKEFFIDQDGVIGADTENYFVPNLATIINFYPLISESINFGGSFGVSIPLSDELRGVNFLIGPSIIFGSNSRVSFSGGLAYGPVKRLTNGLQVGDVTELRSLENFTKTIYEMGYFFGISFSLFDLK